MVTKPLYFVVRSPGSNPQVPANPVDEFLNPETNDEPPPPPLGVPVVLRPPP